jgi:hypothetical protein
MLGYSLYMSVFPQSSHNLLNRNGRKTSLPSALPSTCWLSSDNPGIVA